MSGRRSSMPDKGYVVVKSHFNSFWLATLINSTVSFVLFLLLPRSDELLMMKLQILRPERLILRPVDR